MVQVMKIEEWDENERKQRAYVNYPTVQQYIFMKMYWDYKSVCLFEWENVVLSYHIEEELWRKLQILFDDILDDIFSRILYQI